MYLDLKNNPDMLKKTKKAGEFKILLQKMCVSYIFDCFQSGRED